MFYPHLVLNVGLDPPRSSVARLTLDSLVRPSPSCCPDPFLQMINYGFKKIEGRGPDEVSRVTEMVPVKFGKSYTRVPLSCGQRSWGDELVLSIPVPISSANSRRAGMLSVFLPNFSILGIQPGLLAK